jgi:hypothetical protein
MTLLEHQIRTESPHHRRSRPCWHLWPVLAGVGGCLLSGAAGGAIVLAVHGTGSPAAATGQPASRAAGPGPAAVINATRLAAAIGPAVVNINTRLDALEGGGRAAGTGMIISRNGEIVTNNHVVQGADTVAVTIRGRGTTPVPRQPRSWGYPPAGESRGPGPMASGRGPPIRHVQGDGLVRASAAALPWPRWPAPGDVLCSRGRVAPVKADYGHWETGLLLGVVTVLPRWRRAAGGGGRLSAAG